MILKREEMFRLGLGCKPFEEDAEYYPDLTEAEVKECEDFGREMMLFARQCMNEYVKEQGYEFVSTGRGKERIFKRRENGAGERE